MRTFKTLAIAAVVSCAGMASAAQASPMPATVAVVGQPGLIENVQYYNYESYRRHQYRAHVRRAWAKERRYDAHLRRQENNYRRRAYRYGY